MFAVQTARVLLVFSSSMLNLNLRCYLARDLVSGKNPMAQMA